jgi:hypothetical protein
VPNAAPTGEIVNAVHYRQQNQQVPEIASSHLLDFCDPLLIATLSSLPASNDARNESSNQDDKQQQV